MNGRIDLDQAVLSCLLFKVGDIVKIEQCRAAYIGSGEIGLSAASIEISKPLKRERRIDRRVGGDGERGNKIHEFKPIFTHEARYVS